jgi:hypothetical protein
MMGNKGRAPVTSPILKGLKDDKLRQDVRIVHLAGGGFGKMGKRSGIAPEKRLEPVEDPLR